MAADLMKTVALLQRAKAEHPRVLVGLSGGKDSLVVLDLCVRVWGRENVECYAMYFLAGLRCFDIPVDSAGNRWKVKVHKYQHHMTSNMIRKGVFRNHIKEVLTGAVKMPKKIGIKDIWKLARRDANAQLVATGERMDESLHRRGQLHKCAGYDTHRDDGTRHDNPRIFPLWNWSARDVMSYLRNRRIPIPVGVGKRNMSGIDLRAETLAYLKEHWPADYEKILEVFPYAEVQLFRNDMLAQRVEDEEEEETTDA